MLEAKIAHQLASIGHLQSENCISHLESVHLRRQTYKKDAYVPQKMSLLQSEQYRQHTFRQSPKGSLIIPKMGIA